MKQAPFVLPIYLFLTVTVQAENTDVEKELPDADFLEFLAEVETETGDGFTAWLETNMEADTENIHTTQDEKK